MKHLKQVIAQIQTEKDLPYGQINDLVWEFICYPPKMPLRNHQEQLLTQAEHSTLQVEDVYFGQGTLSFNVFKWGNGSRKLLITHGWGSKAADFSDVINALLTLDDVQIISFDSPANGSSEGNRSNLLIFVDAVKTVINKFGQPDVLIGHSIGALANVVVLNDLGSIPELLFSITPLIKLKENFEASMTAVGLPASALEGFMKSFEERYGMLPTAFHMDRIYNFGAELNHWLVYDEQDQVSPFAYMEPFINVHPSIKTIECNGAGHDRILKSEVMIAGLMEAVKSDFS